MKIKNFYQTIPLPDGTIQGVFPTVDWFQTISNYIDFKNKTVLDLGCCSFSYGIQAVETGAATVTGVEVDPTKVTECQEIIEHCGITNAATQQGRIEDYPFTQYYDVTIMSMIIHHLDNPVRIIQRAAKSTAELVFVYRYPKPNQKEPGFRPTKDELDQIVPLTPKAHFELMKTDTQYINLAIYG